MKKLFMILCVVILFFGIVASTSYDDLAPKSATSSIVTKSQIGDNVASSVSTPVQLLLLGFGLIGLAEFGRRKIKK